MCLGLSIGLFASGYLTEILRGFVISPVHATCPLVVNIFVTQTELHAITINNCALD
jgi:hypothetical protein